MGVGNRLLLALYALATMALTVALTGILVPILPEREWLNEVRYVTGQPEVLAACFCSCVPLLRRRRKTAPRSAF